MLPLVVAVLTVVRAVAIVLIAVAVGAALTKRAPRPHRLVLLRLLPTAR